MDIIADIINFLIDLLVIIITGIMALLPQTPFKFDPLDWGLFGDAVGYFLPIGTMVAHLTIILASVGLWYAVRWLFRLIQMIR